jgi:hypothetical protein
LRRWREESTELPEVDLRLMLRAISKDNYNFVTFFLKGNNFSCGNSLRDINCQIYFFLGNFAPIAIFTLCSFVKEFAHTFAVFTVFLYLGKHARSKLNELYDTSLSLTNEALLNVLSSLALAALT